MNCEAQQNHVPQNLILQKAGKIIRIENISGRFTVILLYPVFGKDFSDCGYVP
jgi:hypothetical protein